MTDITISDDDERAPLDRAGLKYVGEPVGWAGLWTYHDHQIRLNIDGNEHGPYAGFIRLAEIVLPKLEEIERASDVYLREFVADGGGFYRGSWRIQSLQMRRNPGSKSILGTEFKVTLSIAEDDYGEWSVGFRCHTYPSPRGLSPYLFSRRQW